MHAAASASLRLILRLLLLHNLDDFVRYSQVLDLCIVNTSYVSSQQLLLLCFRERRSQAAS